MYIPKCLTLQPKGKSSAQDNHICRRNWYDNITIYYFIKASLVDLQSAGGLEGVATRQASATEHQKYESN